MSLTVSESWRRRPARKARNARPRLRQSTLQVSPADMAMRQFRSRSSIADPIKILSRKPSFVLCGIPLIFLCGVYVGIWLASSPSTRTLVIIRDPLDIAKQGTRLLNFTELMPAQFNYRREEQQAERNESKAVYCSINPRHCELSRYTTDLLKKRSKFSAQNRVGSNISIFVDKDSMELFYGNQPWFNAIALEMCSIKACRVVDRQEIANVWISNHRPLSPKLKNVTYAVVNLEAHSFEFVVNEKAENVMLVSYRQESDLMINYAFHITHKASICIGQRIDGQSCDTMENPASPFHKWCTAKYDGEVFACLFNVMPHIMHKNYQGKLAKGFAATWVSASCERHEGYLTRLIKHIEIDSMAGCYHNRDENSHPGLTIKDHDSLYWGESRTVSELATKVGWGPKKVTLASHYWFFISIENTILDDYLTEKFYEGFLSDSLLVYFGAPNAREYAPADHSFINALDFPGPKELADFLVALKADAPRYESYFWWKKTVPVTISKRFKDRMKHSLEHTTEQSMLCRMCAKLTQTSSTPA